MVNLLLQSDVSSKTSIAELNSLETNLQNQIDTKASEMDLQILKVRDCTFLFIEF